MNYHIITTQPDVYESFVKNGLIARGIAKKVINIKIHNLHDYAFDARGTIDETPYGGGAGMVLRVDVMAEAIKKIKRSTVNCKPLTVLLTPQGKKFDQKMARDLSYEKNIIFIAGRFEGYDERIRDLVDEEISVGDFVLTAGDLPAMVVIDAVSRQIPGFIERAESVEIESFSDNSLEYPQYTRPEDFNGKKVPEILLSGNHAKVEAWRKDQSDKRTKDRRPDLIAS